MAVTNSVAESDGRQQTRRKYKDTCSNCASSKVKCNRDKPQCSRCEDRGLQCSYSLSQRSGRRPAANKSPSRSAEQSQAPSKKARKTSEQGEDQEYQQSRALSNDLMDISYPPDVMSFEADMFNSMDMISTEDFETVLKSLGSSVSTPLWPHDINYTNCFAEPLGEPTAMWPNESMFADLQSNDIFMASSARSSLSGTTIYSTTAVPSPQAIDKGVVTTNCSDQRQPCYPTRIAELLNRLRGEKSDHCSIGLQTQSNQQLSTTNFEDIITVNRESINAVMSILECACSTEQQIVFMISMIVFEVLDRYNDAAMEHTKVDPSVGAQPLAFGKYQVEGPDARRMRTALILGELHLVVRLLDRLSRRPGHSDGQYPLLRDHADRSASFASNRISPSVFIQVEADMKKRLNLVRDNLTQLMRQN